VRRMQILQIRAAAYRASQSGGGTSCTTYERMYWSLLPTLLDTWIWASTQKRSHVPYWTGYFIGQFAPLPMDKTLFPL